VNPQYLRIATEVPSGSASNTYGWLSDLPTIKEWVSERQFAQLSQYGYTIANKTWENSIRVKRENIEDDQIGQYSVIAQAFGQQVAEFPDTLSFPLLLLVSPPCALTARTSLIPTIRWRAAPTATLWVISRPTKVSRGS
jgi:phage major head subunit gpT-like protein